MCIILMFKQYKKMHDICVYSIQTYEKWISQNNYCQIVTHEVCDVPPKPPHRKHFLTKITYIINLLSFIGSYKFCAKSFCHKFIQKLYEFCVMVIWMIFVCNQYLQNSNIWNIVFEWHTWMFMFNSQKLHNFMQNYITIFAWI
jgi:hypothetical protein